MLWTSAEHEGQGTMDGGHMIEQGIEGWINLIVWDYISSVK